ncbi:MAG: hypothetical protein R2710_11010 [Acidimicrobiales bacterium]
MLDTVPVERPASTSGVAFAARCERRAAISLAINAADLDLRQSGRACTRRMIGDPPRYDGAVSRSLAMADRTIVEDRGCQPAGSLVIDAEELIARELAATGPPNSTISGARWRSAEVSALGSELAVLNVMAPGGRSTSPPCVATIDAAESIGIDPDQIVLEAVERNRYADLHDAARQLESFRRRGVRIAVDDVGDGSRRAASPSTQRLLARHHRRDLGPARRRVAPPDRLDRRRPPIGLDSEAVQRRLRVNRSSGPVRSGPTRRHGRVAASSITRRHWRTSRALRWWPRTSDRAQFRRLANLNGRLGPGSVPRGTRRTADLLLSSSSAADRHLVRALSSSQRTGRPTMFDPPVGVDADQILSLRHPIRTAGRGIAALVMVAPWTLGTGDRRRTRSVVKRRGHDRSSTRIGNRSICRSERRRGVRHRRRRARRDDGRARADVDADGAFEPNGDDGPAPG